MKLYSTGIIGFIASVASLVTCMEINQQFHDIYPQVYWVGQIVFCMLFLVTTGIALVHWESKTCVTKFRFVLSIVIYMCMYAIAYTGSKYSFMLIFVIGVTEIYLTRKRFGLVKR